MSRNTLILGIESSCDDTSVSLVRDHELLDCIVMSSAEEQAKYGGVVPEVAARAHERNFIPMIRELFDRTGVYWREITHISYTDKPGLEGCLLVGKVFAKTLAFIHNKPLIAVNHVYSHIFSSGLTDNIVFPALALVISGKTTAIYYLRGFKDIELIDQTLDNALGEVYDKVAREIGLKYPGGSKIDELFNPERKVPNLLKHSSNPAKPFSYAGILSAVVRLWQDLKKQEIINKHEYVATIFQKWVVLGLVKKIKYWSFIKNTNVLYVSGGVSANKYLRSEFSKMNLDVHFADLKFTSDNAAMVAYYASHLV